MNLIALILLAQTATQNPVSAEWTQSELRALGLALHAINMTRADLGYDKRPFNDRWRLPCVDAVLDDPLAAPRYVETMRAALESPAPRPSDLAWPLHKLDETPPPGPERLDFDRELMQVPAPLRTAIHPLLRAVAEADAELKAATARLSAAERQELLRGLPHLALEEDVPDARFDFVPEGPRTEPERVWLLLEQLDVRRLCRAADALHAVSSPALTEPLLALARGPLKDWKQTLVIQLPIGKLVVAGTGHDRHDHGPNVVALIDLGGDDTYVGRIGGGLGRPAFSLDLAGNDRYMLSDLSGGAGFLGVGLLVDLAGDEVYEGAHLSLGAGLAGCGVLLDRGGNDTYRGRALTQGFAMFGLGWLDDGSGSDLYDAWFFAQGASATMGVGVMADRNGNDVYRAGGWIMNAPLLEAQKVHYSFAQGFSTGFREDTGGRSGGFGMLYDAAGDDTYSGESYCQAASYWFAFGALLDVSGHDSYDSYYYSQCSPMHLCIATLMDLAGDDSYSCKLGAMHAIGHDYAVAVMLDRSGNDVCAGGDSRPALGNANGVGIYLDAAGNDRYHGPPGNANEARGSGSVGVFVDMAGQDRYYESFGDGKLERRGSWAIALDFADPLEGQTALFDIPDEQLDRSLQPLAPKRTKAATQRPPAPPWVPNIPEDPDLEPVYRDAMTWEVGTARDKVRAARQRLIEIGMPACRYMVDRHIGDSNRLADRAFEEVFGALGEPAQQLLAARLDDPHPEVTRNALRILTTLKSRLLGPHLPALLEQEAYRKSAIRAAGALAVTEAVPQLRALLSDEDETVALEAAIALGQIADPSTADDLVFVLSSPSMPLREAAATALARLGPASLPAVIATLDSENPAAARLALSVLRRTRYADADRHVSRLMDHADWGVRLECVDTLFALEKGAWALTHEGRESHPLVLARLRTLDRDRPKEPQP